VEGKLDETSKATPNSSMFEHEFSPWAEYDVATRIEELERFVEAKVTPALYDAIQLLKNNPEQTPYWVLEAALEVIEERLKHGFKMVTGANERKLYARELKNYYRYRCVRKNKKNKTWEEAYDRAAEELENTFAAAEPETMRKAYIKVAKDLSNPARAFRYYSAMPKTRECTGTSLVPHSLR
jgi:hypothetical protein